MKKALGKILMYGITCLCFGLAASYIPPEKIASEKGRQIMTGKYIKELLVPGSDFHGVHGLTFDNQNRLYAGSVVGMSIYSVDTEKGNVKTFVGPIQGQADDLEFGPDGTLTWTSYLLGKVHSRDSAGNIKVLAEGLLGINSLAFKQDGRLFASQVFLGDALYEIDVNGKKPPRKIIEKMGGLNGFDFGPDGMLYGPLWFKGQIAKVDVDTGTLEVVAAGFKVPAAANFDSAGNLWVVDTALGEVVKVDVRTGNKKVVAKVKTSIDNLALDSKNNLYISNMADNSIHQINTQTGESRTVVEGGLSVPSGIGVYSSGGVDTIYLADLFAYRSINGSTGEVTDLARMQADTLEYPMSARVNKKTVLLCSWFTGTLQVVDRKTGRTIEMIHKLSAPHDALALPKGGYLVAELGTGKLLKVSGLHGKDRTAVIEKLAGPHGMSWASKDAVYISEVFGGMISRVNINTGQKTVVVSGLKFPEGIDVAPDGKIIVAEVGKKRLIAVNPKNGAIDEIAGQLNVGLPPYPGFVPSQVPTGVGVSSNGTIYMSSDIENAVYKFTPPD